MKNISIHVAIAVVSLVLVVASAFLMTAADWEIRVLANYLTLGWALVFCFWKAAARRRPRTRPLTPPRNRSIIRKEAPPGASFFVRLTGGAKYGTV